MAGHHRLHATGTDELRANSDSEGTVSPLGGRPGHAARCATAALAPARPRALIRILGPLVCLDAPMPTSHSLDCPALLRGRGLRGVHAGRAPIASGFRRLVFGPAALAACPAWGISALWREEGPGQGIRLWQDRGSDSRGRARRGVAG